MVWFLKKIDDFILIFIFSYSLNLSAQNGQKIAADLLNLEVEKTNNLENKVALDKLSKLQKLFEEKNFSEDSTLAKLYHFLGRRYLNISRNEPSFENLKKSVFFTKKAISINSRNKSTCSIPNLSNSLLNFGILYSEFPDIQNEKIAVKSFEICITNSKRFKNKNFIASDALGRLANLEIAKGDFEKAYSYAMEGEKIAKKNQNQKLEICLDKKAEALRNLGKLEEAESVIKELIKIFGSDKTNFFYTNAITNLATIYYEKKDVVSMDYYFNLAFLNFENLGDSYGKSFSLNNHGYCSFKLGNLEKAEMLYFQALKYAENRFLKARIYDNLGVLYFQNKAYGKAIEAFQNALISYLKNFNGLNLNDNPSTAQLIYVSDKDYLEEILANKGKTFLQFYSVKHKKIFLLNSIDCFHLANKLVDFMRQEHTGTLSKYYWRDKTRSLYENAIETCFLLKDHEKAYYFMEKSRAVMLNDKLNELGANQKLNEVDQEKERDSQRKLIELNTKIEAETNATEKEKLNSQLFDLQEQQERFVKSLETKYPAYYQLKYNTQIGTLKQMQAYLKTNFKDKNATMVSFFFGDSASYAMVIGPNNAEVKQFKYDVAQNQEFVNLLATNHGTKADYAKILFMGSVIYQKLIKPLNIPKGHLIISQDGVFMPFEALSTSGSSAQYLLKDYAISYTYSGQFLLKKTTETKFWPNQTFVGFAPVEFKNQLNTLKNSDITLGNVAKNYWFSDTFTGKVATKANFLLQAKDHKIVQIFTHAFADSLDTEPKIYFADNALKISELNAEDQFNTQLLVLSACKTGVGKLAKGEGVLSLARGFSMLGIPATITSLWSVEDKNTYQLTELFYKYLNQGLSKDEALQKAKLEFLELHPNSGPTDWAGMVLVGETDAISSNYYLYFTIFLISVLILFLGFRYFYRRNALNKNPFYKPQTLLNSTKNR